MKPVHQNGIVVVAIMLSAAVAVKCELLHSR
jgi:hypothetical protein